MFPQNIPKQPKTKGRKLTERDEPSKIDKESVWPSKNLTLLHVHVATGAWEEPSAKSCPKIAFKFSQYLFLDKLKKIFERQTRTQHVHYSRLVPTVSHKHGYFDTSNSHDDLWTMSKTCPFYVLNLKLYSQ